MTAPTSREGLLELAAHLDRIVRSNLGLASDKKAVSEAAAALRASVAQNSVPVAWLYEVKIADFPEAWSQRYSDTKPAGNEFQRNIRPLYLAPTSPDSSTDQREGAK